MTEISERYRNVAGQFTQRVQSMPDAAWDNPAPCDGWAARDVVRHLVEWIPGFFQSNADLKFPAAPSVDDDLMPSCTPPWSAQHSTARAIHASSG